VSGGGTLSRRNDTDLCETALVKRVFLGLWWGFLAELKRSARISLGWRGRIAHLARTWRHCSLQRALESSSSFWDMKLEAGAEGALVSLADLRSSAGRGDRCSQDEVGRRRGPRPRLVPIHGHPWPSIMTSSAAKLIFPHDLGTAYKGRRRA
jgi:hypothetical protein